MGWMDLDGGWDGGSGYRGTGRAPILDRGGWESKIALTETVPWEENSVPAISDSGVWGRAR